MEETILVSICLFFNEVMAGLSDIVQKAFYLGVGAVATAGEKAGEKITDLRAQAQKIADELVAKGEITTDEAKKLVDDMIKHAQPLQNSNSQSTPKDEKTSPRRIEIITDNEQTTEDNSPSDVEKMRQQVADLQAELQRLKKNP